MAFLGWTEENVTKLKLLIQEGKTFSETGRALKCSRAAVSGKVKRLGLQPPAKAERPLHYRVAMAPKPPKPPKVRPIYHQPPDHAQLRVVETESKGVPLIDVTGCRYAINKADLGEEHLFCDAPKHPETPYCKAHAKIAYNPESPADRKRAISSAAYVARRCA